MNILRRIHRTLGSIIALFLLVLSITGMMLNHSSDLNLAKHTINWNWLLTHYNIGYTEPDRVYRVGNRIISQFGSQVFIDAKPVTEIQNPLLGAVRLTEFIVLATDNALLLLDDNGQLIERMGATAGVPATIQQIGLWADQAIVQTDNGLWRSDHLLNQWLPVVAADINWSLPASLPDALAVELASYFHGSGITVERLLLDIHNGRILGKLGVYLLDFIAVLLIILSVTGLWIWSKKLR